MPYIGNPIYQSAFVTDQFSGDGSTTAYTMSVAPAGTTNVLVVVSGVVQDPSTYGVVGNTLNFTTAPPTGTGNISCRYLGVPVTGVTTTAYRTVTEFTATASQTTFTPPSYTVGFINVYLNGVRLGSADYTASNGTTVVLTTGASAGNLVTVESFQVSSVANAISNSAGAINLAGSLISGVLPVVNGGTGVTTSTGSGANVLGTSPTLTTPTITTPTISSGSILNSSGRIMAPQTNGIIQVVNATSNTQFSTTSGSYVSTGFTATITPSSTSSKILVIYGCGGIESSGTGATTKGSIQIWRGGASVFTVSQSVLYNTQGGAGPACTFLDSPATTSAVTYTLYFLAVTATFYIGTNSSSNSFTLMEISQ
jgi:hypothetical protein